MWHLRNLTSDITYRIFDFNRQDKDGNLRELHTELALDAIDYRKKDDFKVDYSSSTDRLNPMVQSPYFTTEYLDLTQDLSLDLSNRTSFSIYVCVKGNGQIGAGGAAVEAKMGETILIPAGVQKIDIKTSGMTLLQVTI